MDNENRRSALAAGAIKTEHSGSKNGDRGRLIARAEDEHRPADRSGWSGRWQHPLVKSIQERRRKPSRP
jgi:hypothetical protein